MFAQMDDLYGSPSLDDVAAVSREFYKGLEAAIGEEAAGKLSVEVSSPVGHICHGTVRLHCSQILWCTTLSSDGPRDSANTTCCCDSVRIVML